MTKSLYLTDLNPGRNYGLNHELWCIATGLMIGDSTDRDIMVSGFYPDYNSAVKIDLNEIIDISETNNNLEKLGIKSKLIPFKDGIRWVTTKYINPVFKPDLFDLKGKERFYKMIEKLNYDEQFIYVNLYTTFAWPIMNVYGNDKELCDKAIRVFLSLEPSAFIKDLVNHKIENLSLGEEYYSLHMRLEDDWVNHLTTWKGTPHMGKTFEELSIKFYDEIKNLINEHMNDEKKIFVASGLVKHENKNNHLLTDLEKEYPNKIVYCCDPTKILKEIFPISNNCREIEGYIDFLVCLKSNKSILSSYSSFSVTLRFILPYFDKEFLNYSA